ncbi:MAG TPA: GNAT family N-acetyltransferase [Candidatus Krumholzibacterium sp.]|nr:GNAT family N-acetyltransferase [Candidatus Krumholzibacterium sp.]
MDRDEIVIRDANPDAEEGLACGRFLDETAEGFFSLMLGRQAPEIIARAFTQTGHSYSYRNVAFAEHEGRIIGMTLGFTAGQHRDFSDRPLKKAAGPRALRMAVVKAICSPMIRILNSIEDEEYYVLAVTVEKEFRGMGIGSVLMDSIEKKARAAGCVRLALDVSASNEGAIKLYERRGMRVESRWPKHRVIPGLRLFRMKKTLLTRTRAGEAIQAR